MTGAGTSFSIDNEDTEVVGGFCLLGSTIEHKGCRSQEIHHRLALGTVVINKL